MVDGRIPIKQIGGSITPVFSTDWQMANLNLTLANTEYSYSLPSGTKQFIIQARNNAELRVAESIGETATNYTTIWKGGSLTISDVNFTGKTIYLQSNLAATTVEIVVTV